MAKKKSEKNPIKACLRASAITAASLLLLLGLEAALIQMGSLSAEGAEIGIIACCLIAGTVSTILGPKGKEDKKLMVLPAILPALLLLILSFTLYKSSSMGMAPFLHAACLVLPCLITYICAPGKGRGRRMRKKRR